MGKYKKFFVDLRNGLAFGYSWLVICAVIVSLVNGNDAITVDFLLKLLGLCAWGAFSFTACFRCRNMQKKGFIASLTLFFLLFIPIEIGFLYFMGMFQNKEIWIIFFAIVLAMYLISVLIDVVVMRRKMAVYTEKLEKYHKESEL